MYQFNLLHYQNLDTSGLEKIREINAKIRRSINVAIIVLTDRQKEEARQLFDTPLVFSVQEAKGLEYENVILYHFIDAEKKFLDIADGLDREALNQAFKYGRAKSKSDKSMEVYKFYINSLYVAITRAIKSVCLVEKNPSHPLLSLLDINEINQSMGMDIKESSLKEWQQEASRLAQQGKSEQAAAIAETILKQKTPPWPDFRKKQTYLSGLLSRNEVNSLYVPNRKLFIRISRGYYEINPDLKIKTSSGWESIQLTPLHIIDMDHENQTSVDST